MKKGDLVRVRADHPKHAGLICTFLRYDRLASWGRTQNPKVAVLAAKERRMEDIWVGVNDVEPADVFDKLGKLVEDAG